MSVLKAYCNICNLWLNSHDQLLAHQSGKSHRRREVFEAIDVTSASPIVVQLSEQSRAFAQMVANQENSSKVNSQNNTQDGDENCKQQQDDNAGQTDLGRTKLPKGEEFCNICVVQLTSRSQADMHFEGSKHKKALAVIAGKREEIQYDGVKKNTEDVCEICNVPLSSKAVADAHFAGSKHEKKVKLSQLLRGNPGPAYNGDRAQPPTNMTTITTALSQSGPGSSISVVPVPAGSVGLQRMAPVGSFMYCSFCGVSVNSKQQMDAHWQGSKHKNNVNGRVPQAKSSYTPRHVPNQGRFVSSTHIFPHYGSANGQAMFRTGQSIPYVSHQY